MIAHALAAGAAFATAVLVGRWLMGVTLTHVSNWIGAGE